MDLGSDVEISGLAIQGRNNSASWVTAYTVMSYKDEDDGFRTVYNETGGTMFYVPSLINTSTGVYHSIMFNETRNARAFEVKVKNWLNGIGMRVGYIHCN